MSFYGFLISKSYLDTKYGYGLIPQNLRFTHIDLLIDNSIDLM